MRPPSTKRTFPRGLLILGVFLVVLVGVRLSIRPINRFDYEVCVRAVQALLQGKSPYSVDLYAMPPWSLLMIAPLSTQPIELWLALDAAIFVAMLLDLGTPFSLAMLLHPVFIVLIAAANPEWLVIGPGLWLLYRRDKGIPRGVAWLLLLCKPQTSIFLLVLDGVQALRERDWKAFLTTGSVASLGYLLFPDALGRLGSRFEWSLTIVSSYGILAAALATVVLVALRWQKRRDRRSIALLLAPIWSPYMLQHGLMATLFTMRRAGLLRQIIFVVASIVFAALFWNAYHEREQLGALAMVWLAALLAPENPSRAT